MDFRVIERELREFFEAEGSTTANMLGDVYVSTAEIRSWVDSKNQSRITASLHGEIVPTIVNLTELAKRLADLYPAASPLRAANDDTAKPHRP